jgi:F0F1-type ATP synthase gamma subunit
LQEKEFGLKEKGQDIESQKNQLSGLDLQARVSELQRKPQQEQSKAIIDAATEAYKKKEITAAELMQITTNPTVNTIQHKKSVWSYLPFTKAYEVKGNPVMSGITEGTRGW